MNIRVDGYNINYKMTGQGEKMVVILQGWGTHMSIYDSVAAALSRTYRVLQFDFPGFGESDEPREPWDVDGYADFFCKLMQELEIKKMTVIGHSYGGRVIIKLAARDSLPFELEKIVLIDSAGVLPVRTTKQKIKIANYKVLKKIFAGRVVNILFPEIVEDWRSRQGSEDYRNASPMMRQCLVKAVNEDLTELLSKVKQDTLLVWGEMDTATPLRDAKIMEEKIPHAGLVVLEGCGHFSFLEQPVKFGGIIQSYLGA